MDKKIIAAALEISPRTKLSYKLVLARAVHYARSMGLRDGLSSLDSAAVGLSHWLDTGRASGTAFWNIQRMSAYKIVALLCDCAHAIQEYSTVGGAAEYYRERFDVRLVPPSGLKRRPRRTPRPKGLLKPTFQAAQSG